MSTQNNNNTKEQFRKLDPDSLPFPVEGMRGLSDTEKKEISAEMEREKKEEARIKQLKEAATFPHLPKDPAYRAVPEDILTINEFNKNLETSTRIMINVALGEYCIVREVDDQGNDHNRQLLFKRVTYDEYGEYQEIQEKIDDLNNRINLLRSLVDKTEQTFDRIREYQKQLKGIVDEKAEKGLKTFFKPNDIQKAILTNKKNFDYNDLLLSVEIGYFRYTRSPFLRSISSSSST